MHPGRQEGQQHPVLYEQEHSQETEGGHYSSLLSTHNYNIMPGFGFPRIHRQTEVSSTDSHQDGHRAKQSKERLMDRVLFSLEKRQLLGDLTAACQYFQRDDRGDGARLFTVVHG